MVTNNSTDGATVLKSHLGVWRGCVINRQRSSNVTAGVLGQLDRSKMKYLSFVYRVAEAEKNLGIVQAGGDSNKRERQMAFA